MYNSDSLKNKLNRDINEKYVAFDIADTNRVVHDGSIETNDNGSFFTSNGLYSSEFNEVIVNVQKNETIYTMDYKMS
ncbi:hypothetical protein ACFQ3R_05865 [Mesonia ostreae]|uniref:Uncharacterized protein n=1 Tax=Mesonia ostreae TaxID=861110 RepID=A0ABU2KJP9_9FLAO|nr:hypothetical protein [Mesonia ostreae]MDT0294948.1 hypothetical protein [Mesonia ostreae]